MKTQRSALLLGVLAGGLVLSQQACSVATEQQAEATVPVSATQQLGTTAVTPVSTGDPILAGKRQVVIKPLPSYESIVAVDGKGRLNLTDGEAEFGLFVFSPVGDKWQIKTAKADSSGEPACMGLKHNGTAPLTIVAAACDTSRAGQLFDLSVQEAKDNGRPTYAISSQSAFLQVSPASGLIAEELGDAPLRTTFSLVDNGPANLPVLD